MGKFLSHKVSGANHRIMTGNDRESRSQRRKSSTNSAGASDNSKMAAQSQGIKQLMAAEKEAAQVVANARKSESPGGP